jgi:hypothetical protein
MSRLPTPDHTFLLDQRVSLLDPGRQALGLLDVDAARELRDRGGFREHGKDSPWKNLNRDDWLARTRCGDLSRTLLVADAGIGKTTNMAWLARRLTETHRSHLVFLLTIDQLPDDPDQVFDVLLRERWRSAAGCSDADGLTRDQAVRTLRAFRDAGRLVLLLDSIDQALSCPKVLDTLRLLLTRADWRACPVVVSSRPHALTSQWNALFAGQEAAWRFVRVEQLDSRQQEYLLGTVPDEDDPSGNRRVSRYSLLPADGRALLGVPRVIELLRRACGRRADFAGLRTQADVYWRCVNEMLLDGLRADAAGDTLGWSRTGTAVPEAYRGVQRVLARNILGAVAFEMFTDGAGGRPNLSHVAASGCDEFLMRVFARMETSREAHRAARRTVDATQLGSGELDQFFVNFTAVTAMNAGPLENYLLDDGGRHRDIRWRNPTMQAFFAAAWVCRHGSPDDLDRIRGWVVDEDNPRYGDLREFWRFVCELGGTAEADPTATHRETWVAVLTPLYDGSAVDGKGRPVRSPEFIWRSWERMAGTVARAKFLEQFPAIRRGEQGSDRQRLADQMMAGFVRLVGNPALNGDTGEFWMGATDEEGGYSAEKPRHRVKLTKPYLLHQYCVTNEEYELFDSRHSEQRWSDEPHPLVAKSGDDRCPVVNVSWYAAWCFAVWSGCRLPSEAEWEYGCRAGLETPYSVGDGRELTAEVCNFGGNVSHTVPVDGLAGGANGWGFHQMHGNVDEWCEDWYRSQMYTSTARVDPVGPESGSYRVDRGGSWFDAAWFCRSAFRSGDGPVNRYRLRGFRLAAVPSGRQGG